MAINDLLTAEASVLFEKLNWPMPSDEEWRRTDLARLLPAGTLESGVDATWSDRASAEITRADQEKASKCGVPSGYAANAGNPVPDAGQRTFSQSETYAAHIVTQAGRPVSITLSAKAEEAGLIAEWVNPGQFSETLIQMGTDELHASQERVAAWHWRDLPGSLVLRVPSGITITEPIVVEEHLVAVDEKAPLVTVPHLHIEAGESSAISVIWSFEGSPEVSKTVTPIVNAGLSADAANNASVDITLRQVLGDRIVFFLHDRLAAARDVRIRFHEVHLGGSLVKTRVRAVLNGPGAEAVFKGLFVAPSGRHMDLGIRQEHRAPSAFSDALYKGAISPGGRSIFQGLIEVAPHASKTDAYLTNNNLILADGARADSLPQLDILTDDVKCSHGATSGKIDPVHIFYLQSRGFSPEEARRELILGFLGETLDGIPEAVAGILTADLDAALEIAENEAVANG